MTQSYGLGAKCPAQVTLDAQVTPVYGIQRSDSQLNVEISYYYSINYCK